MVPSPLISTGSVSNRRRRAVSVPRLTSKLANTTTDAGIVLVSRRHQTEPPQIKPGQLRQRRTQRTVRQHGGHRAGGVGGKVVEGVASALQGDPALQRAFNRGRFPRIPPTSYVPLRRSTFACGTSCVTSILTPPVVSHHARLRTTAPPG